MLMESLKQFSWPLVLAITLHIVLLAMFILSFNSKSTLIKTKPVPEIIQATVLDETLIQGEVERLKQLEEDKRTAEEKHQMELEAKRLSEEKKIKELKQKRIAEEEKAKQEDLKRQKSAEQQKKKLAEIKKKKELEEKQLAIIKQQKEAEKKKQLEAKRKKEAEAIRKKKAEAKRKKEEAQQQAAAKREAEEAQKKAEQEMKAKASIADAINLIERKVNRSWIRPASVEAGLNCVIRVKVVPGGDVMDAVVIESSGNVIFDRSAENAVRKASPLPVPSDPYVFAKFRTFRFSFKPPY